MAAGRPARSAARAPLPKASMPPRWLSCCVVCVGGVSARARARARACDILGRWRRWSSCWWSGTPPRPRTERRAPRTRCYFPAGMELINLKDLLHLVFEIALPRTERRAPRRPARRAGAAGRLRVRPQDGVGVGVTRWRWWSRRRHRRPSCLSSWDADSRLERLGALRGWSSWENAACHHRNLPRPGTRPANASEGLLCMNQHH